MKRLLLLSLFSCAVLLAAAQPNEEQSPAGYYNLTQLSFIIGETDELSATVSKFVPSVTTINGYRFNEHFAAGVGVGIAVYEYMVFPVFIDLRWSVFKGAFTPVVAFKGGYSFADNDRELFPYSSGYYYNNLEYHNTGGWMGNPEVGFKVTANRHFDFMFTLGYYYQGLESEVKEPSYYGIGTLTHNISTNVNRLSFTIGFLFK
jgi:hypothetical protein